MRVILEVVSGPEPARKVPLRAGQRLQVGRTEYADLTLAHDGHMSSLHFALETDSQGCRIEDLGSSNGTLLNGRPVTGAASIYDGDRIQAGQTEFIVHAEGQERQTKLNEPHVLGPSATPARPPAPATGSITYSIEIGNSRLLTLRGRTDPASPQQLAALLNKAFPLYLVVDLARLDESLPEELEKPEYLFDWLPAESRGVFTQVIFSETDPVDPFSWIERSWGQDALVCLFCRQERSELLAHLRRTAGAFARPTILAPHLQLAAPEGARNLFGGIDGVLMEGASAAQWTLIGAESLLPVVEKLGFQKSPESSQNERPSPEP